jgi:tRNA modification GTPase
MPTLINDTIAAVSTPLGKSGLGVIRMSGKDSRRITLSLFSDAKQDLHDRLPVLGHLREPQTGEVIDQVIVTFFQSPRSFTREDVVEISCHGSPVVLRTVLGLLLESGARLATPGEFTLRAFLRGRIDLLQAEAIHDLIEAQTLFQAKVALQQASGSLSRSLKPIKEQLVRLIALLEAGIDFAEDDVSVLPEAEVEQRLEPIEAGLKRLQASFEFGKIVSAGLTIAIIGRPNVGKSSVFNALLQKDRAIVTEIPGTTRDLISETMQIHGIPVRLVDTAGIREADDRVERLGVDRSVGALADADRVLFVVDGSEVLQEEDFQILARLTGRSFFLVINKIDLPQHVDAGSIKRQAQAVLSVSAKTTQGIEALTQALFEEYGRERLLENEHGLVTNVRQERAISESIIALSRSRKSLVDQMPHEVVLLDFYAALKSLNALTGETTVEDILGDIFSTFCIGK